MLILLIIVVLIFMNVNKNKNKDNFNQNIKHKVGKNVVSRSIDHTNSVNLLKNTNTNFIEAQFHNDYRDTIMAFNNIAPSQKKIFNPNNKQVVFTNVNKHEVVKIISDFIIEINKDILTNNNKFNNINKDNSGWGKKMEELGLPKNLYADSANKNIIKLIKIDHIEKYETDDEIKYTCYLFIKKINVDDILSIKLSFVVNKNNDTNIIIEDIFVIGYFVSENIINDSFYNYNDLIKNDNIMDDKQILKQLNEKLVKRHKETQRFDDTLDYIDKDMKASAPHISNYGSYQVTQTIFDDINNKKHFS